MSKKEIPPHHCFFPLEVRTVLLGQCAYLPPELQRDLCEKAHPRGTKRPVQEGGPGAWCSSHAWGWLQAAGANRDGGHRAWGPWTTCTADRQGGKELREQVPRREHPVLPPPAPPLMQRPTQGPVHVHVCMHMCSCVHGWAAGVRNPRIPGFAPEGGLPRTWAHPPVPGCRSWGKGRGWWHPLGSWHARFLIAPVHSGNPLLAAQRTQP